MDQLFTKIDGSTLFTRADGVELLVARGDDVAAAALAFFGPPPVIRLLVRKSTVIRRLHEAGLLASVMGVLDMPANIYAKSRWWSPDWPEIYTDDPDAVAVISAVGGDVSVILAAD